MTTTSARHPTRLHDCPSRNVVPVSMIKSSPKKRPATKAATPVRSMPSEVATSRPRIRRAVSRPRRIRSRKSTLSRQPSIRQVQRDATVLTILRTTTPLFRHGTNRLRAIRTTMSTRTWVLEDLRRHPTTVMPLRHVTGLRTIRGCPTAKRTLPAA